MKIARDYVWNNHHYVVVQRDDGTTVEMKGELDMTNEDALTKCPPVSTCVDVPTVTLSDAELVQEVTRRGLKIKIVGNVV